MASEVAGAVSPLACDSASPPHRGPGSTVEDGEPLARALHTQCTLSSQFGAGDGERSLPPRTGAAAGGGSRVQAPSPRGHSTTPKSGSLWKDRGRPLPPGCLPLQSQRAGQPGGCRVFGGGGPGPSLFPQAQDTGTRDPRLSTTPSVQDPAWDRQPRQGAHPWLPCWREPFLAGHTRPWPG